MPPKADRGRMLEKTLSAVLGLRLEQLASEFDDHSTFLKKVGISQGTYYTLIRGDANPTLDTLELIARGLGLSVWELIGLNNGVVKDALSEHEIDLEAVTSASRARANAVMELHGQRLQPKKKSEAPGRE